jgi:hypothetical protein
VLQDSTCWNGSGAMQAWILYMKTLDQSSSHLHNSPNIDMRPLCDSRVCRDARANLCAELEQVDQWQFVKPN